MVLSRRSHRETQVSEIESNNGTRNGDLLLDEEIVEKESDNLMKEKPNGIDLRSSSSSEEEEEPPLYLTSSENPSTSQPAHKAIPHTHTSIVPTKSFSYEEVAAATDDFSDAKCLSRGAFSQVYRAKLLDTQVTIKKFAEDNETGFLSEILTISRTNHPNILNMLGYCIGETTRMLVLQFIPSNTLDFHLYGGETPSINWPNRMKIALGVAKGLTYLHEDCDPSIIHRNIKASNVLLDFDFEPKITGFDFAISIQRSVSKTVTQSLGTGYMFPENCSDHRHFDKYDVFSFGLILLGLITGKKPFSYVEDQSPHLATQILPLMENVLKKKKYMSVVDPTLGNAYIEEEMGRMIHCAAACIYKPENIRPHMKEIFQALKGEISTNLIWQHNNDKTHLNALEGDIPMELIWQ